MEKDLSFIPVHHKGGAIELASLFLLHHITGALYISGLRFDTFDILRKIVQKKRVLDREKQWLSAYFQKDVLAGRLPDVSLRWVNDEVGWGVFTEREFKKMEYITEYTGKIRKRSKADRKNPYCFEYRFVREKPTPFIIDAMDQGGISRYINHDVCPNLIAAMINVAGIGHIILYTIAKIPPNTQLSYNYGPDYWRSRKKPQSFS